MKKMFDVTVQVTQVISYLVMAEDEQEIKDKFFALELDLISEEVIDHTGMRITDIYLIDEEEPAPEFDKELVLSIEKA